MNMTLRILSTLAVSLLLSVNVYAASARHSNNASQDQGSGGSYASSDSVGSYSSASRGSRVSVPELDGSMAFLALGLAFAVVGVAREKRRSR